MTEKTKTIKAPAPGPIKVLTIHNVMGEQQSFNNQNYSWLITRELIEVWRNDQKWHGYFPMANVVAAYVEEMAEAKP